MVIMSMKLNKMWLYIAVGTIIAALVAVVVWNFAKPKETSETSARAQVQPVKLKDNADRVNFIRSFG